MDLTKEEEEVILKMRNEKSNNRRIEILAIIEEFVRKANKAKNQEDFNSLLFEVFDLLQPELKVWTVHAYKEARDTIADNAAELMTETLNGLKNLLSSLSKD